MAKEMEYRLEIGYDGGWSANDESKRFAWQDEAIREIAERYGFEQDGSGGDFGCRDIDFSRETPLEPEQIEALRKDVQALEDLAYAAYTHEMWDHDEGELYEEEGHEWDLTETVQ